MYKCFTHFKIILYTNATKAEALIALILDLAQVKKKNMSIGFIETFKPLDAFFRQTISLYVSGNNFDSSLLSVKSVCTLQRTRTTHGESGPVLDQIYEIWTIFVILIFK